MNITDLEFTQTHYEKMLELDEDYKAFSPEELKAKVLAGAEKVAENKGFANLEKTATEEEMINVGTFIEFRTAKKLLGEYVEEIDD